jgi:2-polyprenyl-3-methyl-5-hydroxy-6-metoxy-1,4-benzoquinol methylase
VTERPPALDFVSAHLPSPPARVLDAGCGQGALTRELIDRGYDARGIDPEAPEGLAFERVGLEDLRVERRYDVAIAVVSLHHVADLALSVERLADAIVPGGLLLVDEFDREQLDPSTTAWWWRQRQALAAAGVGPEPEQTTAEEHHVAMLAAVADIFPWETIDTALTARFEERSVERAEYLYRYETHPAVAPLERAMIDLGAIRATGVRYVGFARE